MKTTHAVILVVLAVIAGGLLFVHLRHPMAAGPATIAAGPTPSKPSLPAKLAAPAVEAVHAANAKTAQALEDKSASVQSKPITTAAPSVHKPEPVAAQLPIAEPAPVVTPAAVAPPPPLHRSIIASSSIMNPSSDVINAPAPTDAPAPNAPATATPDSTPIMSAAPPANNSSTAAAWTPPSPTPAQPNWTWTTTDGHVYHKVKVLKMDPQTITILHQDGGAAVSMDTLPPDLQKLFNYNPEAAAQWGVGKLVAGNLVALRNNVMVPVNDAELRPARYIAIYYSAGWCAPCHSFTPRLVKFYRGFKPIHSDFEIIFVSEDRNPVEMAGYMREMEMPWLAVAYGALVHPPGTFKGSGIEGFAGSGIPDLVLLDATGKVLLDSYQNGKYIGPEAVMNDIPSIVK